MAFLVQSDAGDVQDANAYCDVAFFKGHHDDRGVGYGSANDAAIERALILATDYVDMRWRTRFRGQRKSSAQNTEWPRSEAFDDLGSTLEGIPRRLKQAVAEYALRALTTKLLVDAPRSVLPDGSVQAAGTVIETTSKVGPIEETVKYGDAIGGAGGTSTVDGLLLPAIPSADLMVETLLKGSGGQRSSWR